MNISTSKRIDSEERFEFGKNWSSFLKLLTPERIATSRESVQKLLAVETLQGQRFLDAGSGSGLFSLVANQLGAEVTSFDYDKQSVACTELLQKKYGVNPATWKVLQGSLLDASFMEGLGQYDVVYCWGVAHHTGNMWLAIEHLTKCVVPGGKIVIAIYNDQKTTTTVWKLIKQIYQKLPNWARPIYVVIIGTMHSTGEFIQRLFMGIAASCWRLITLRNPLTPFIYWIKDSYRPQRGMDAWHDLVDWIGGWPFEVSKVDVMFKFFKQRELEMIELTQSDGHGCNEYVFRRSIGTH